MTGLFDGLASLVSDVFGQPVLYLPAQGAARQVISVFREDPVPVSDAEGRDILVMAASWRVRADLVPELRRGDRIAPFGADGAQYRVLAVQGSGSIAADAFAICPLEKLQP